MNPPQPPAVPVPRHALPRAPREYISDAEATAPPTCLPRYQPLVARAGGVGGTLAVVILNSGTLATRVAWNGGLCNLPRYFGDAWTFVCLDRPCMDFLAEASELLNTTIPSFFDDHEHLGVLGGRVHRLWFGAAKYYQMLTCVRLRTILGLLECGVNVIMVGSDVWHSQDPFRFFKPSRSADPDDGVDIVVSYGGMDVTCSDNITQLCAADRPGDNLGHRMNGDYYVAYPTPRTIRYFRLVLAVCTQDERNDQDTFGSVLTDAFEFAAAAANTSSHHPVGRPRLHCLDQCVFANGAHHPAETWRVQQKHSYAYPVHPPVMVHRNWYSYWDKSKIFEGQKLWHPECMNEVDERLELLYRDRLLNHPKKKRAPNAYVVPRWDHDNYNPNTIPTALAWPRGPATVRPIPQPVLPPPPSPRSSPADLAADALAKSLASKTAAKEALAAARVDYMATLANWRTALRTLEMASLEASKAATAALIVKGKVSSTPQAKEAAANTADAAKTAVSEAQQALVTMRKSLMDADTKVKLLGGGSLISEVTEGREISPEA